MVILVIGIVFLSGCLQAQPKLTEKDVAIKACKTACENARIKGENLENGPCLLNPIQEVQNWVCDVAHSPREAVDNQRENQCSEYGKTAKHFVEVDPSCEFIKAI